MKSIVFISLFFLGTSLLSCQSTNEIYIVRHAEKSTEPPNDPHLTAAGRERAEALKEFLKDKNVKAIFSTKTNRTVETATSLGTVINIPIQYYGNDSLTKFLQSVIDLKKNSLIVGHSNTIIPLLSGLNLPHTINAISDGDYGNLFTIKVKDGKAVKIIETTYGRVSPLIK